MAASNDQPDVSHGTDSAINPSDANQANDPVLEVLLDLVAEVLSQGDPGEKASALEALGPNPTWEEIYEEAWVLGDFYGQAIFQNDFCGYEAQPMFGLKMAAYGAGDYLEHPVLTHTLRQLADAIRSDLEEKAIDPLFYRETSRVNTSSTKTFSNTRHSCGGQLIYNPHPSVSGTPYYFCHDCANRFDVDPYWHDGPVYLPPASSTHCSCGGRWVKRSGPYGPFYGCSNFDTTGCRKHRPDDH